MDPIRVDLVSLRRPVEYQFPNEQWVRIEPFRGQGKALLRAWQQDPGNAELLIELLHLAAPTATADDLASLSVDEDIPRVLAAADGKAALLEEYLKNLPSDGARQVPSPTPPSGPTTTSSMSSGGSPGSTGNAGNPSTTTTGTKRSSRSPRSLKSNASTRSSGTTGTSETSASP